MTASRWLIFLGASFIDEHLALWLPWPSDVDYQTIMLPDLHGQGNRALAEAVAKFRKQCAPLIP
jgi:hypothetical protein